jgi:asparagine synthase (glutamine-hydrolysing)
MCGIAGVIGFERNADGARVAADSEGTWNGRTECADVALAHTRLAILDLSRAGHQPMRRSDAVLTYNGEVYNFRTLRADLETAGTPFRSGSDTEVALAAYGEWGEGFLSRLDGMFALGLWDHGRRRLLLARDRLGIKPLYYYRTDAHLVFASEIRALLSSGLVPARLDRSGLWHYLGHQTAPTPLTLVEGVRMLEPGHVLVADDSGHVVTRPYWTLSSSLEESGSRDDDVETAHSRIAELLAESVHSHLVSDVPVGVFLSGGIDSSALVSILRSENVTPRTFSVTFDEDRFDESQYARLVARTFGTEHTELRLSAPRLLEMMPQALSAVDHPSGDGVNTYVVSRMVREAGLKVAISGLGGDEVFGGYPSFRRLDRWLPLIESWGRVPARLKQVAADAVRGVGGTSTVAAKAAAVMEGDGTLASVWPVTRQVFSRAERRRLLTGDAVTDEIEEDAYERMLAEAYGSRSAAPLWGRVSYAEARAYLHDVLLRDTDQMSMAHGLEVRVPLLDHRLVSYVLGLNDDVRRSGSQTKSLLTQSLPVALPPEIIERPKRGFTLPFDDWMRGPLQGLCDAHLGERGLEGRRVFARGEVQELWRQFQRSEGTVTWSRLWTLVALDSWLGANGLVGDPQ